MPYYDQYRCLLYAIGNSLEALSLMFDRAEVPPSISNPQPSILDSKPQTLDVKPSNPNPQRQTLNPQL